MRSIKMFLSALVLCLMASMSYADVESVSADDCEESLQNIGIDATLSDVFEYPQGGFQITVDYKNLTNETWKTNTVVDHCELSPGEKDMDSISINGAVQVKYQCDDDFEKDQFKVLVYVMDGNKVYRACNQ